MLNVHTAESLSSLITFIISYLCSVTIAGYCASWVALKVGDTTPEQEGFLTLNPLVHVDIIGLLFMIIYNFGWGRFIPLNPFSVMGRNRIFKLIALYTAESLTHWLLSFISILCLIGLFGTSAVLILSKPIYAAFPQSSSYTLAIGLILISFVMVNIMLMVVTQLININGLLIAWYTHHYPDSPFYTRLLVVALPIIVYAFYGTFLMRFMLMITWYAAYLFLLFFRII